VLSSHYLESRQIFLGLAGQAGAAIRRYFQEDGEETARLSTDIAYLGPADADKLIIVASGTHGIEGYAGSSCQFGFLRDYASRYTTSGLGFLLVHAVNPWGYFHDRRVTEEGIDLNRNFVDFPVKPDTGRSYDTFHNRLVKRYRPLPGGWWNELCLLSGALSAARRRRIQEAITTGQYHRAEGLFFGGQSPAKSRVTWESIVDEFTRGRRSVFLLDIHSGLGKRGIGELISYLPESSEGFQELSRWFSGELKSMAAGDSVTAAVEGTLTAAFDRRVTATSHAVGLEFGTVAPLAVLNALRADQWCRLNAAQLTPRQREWARRKMKAAFAPADAQWYSQITARFQDVIGRIVAGMG
jgi:hypothetical protein